MTDTLSSDIIYDIKLNNIYQDIIKVDCFEDNYKKLQKLKSKDKIILASMIVNKWIDSYLNNPDDVSLSEQCKYFISIMSEEDIFSLIINNTNNDVNKLIQILKLFDKSYIKLNKNNLFFDNIDCLNYITNNFGYYDKQTINKILYDMAINYYYVDNNIVDWIINNYDNFIKNNIVDIITNIMKSSNYANVDNSYLIIEKLLNIDNINKLSIFNIFKKSIYYNHFFAFELFMHDYYENINHVNMFELVCIYTNPESPIEKTLVPYIYNINKTLHTINFKCLYNKLKEINIHNVVKWFDTYFDDNFKLLLNETEYMFTNINIKKEHHNETCMICYENSNNIVSLGCCSSHITCSSCLKEWLNNKNTCPMCREEIIFNNCTLYVK
jgi:hypothetical protein